MTNEAIIDSKDTIFEQFTNLRDWLTSRLNIEASDVSIYISLNIFGLTDREAIELLGECECKTTDNGLRYITRDLDDARRISLSVGLEPLDDSEDVRADLAREDIEAGIYDDDDVAELTTDRVAEAITTEEVAAEAVEKHVENVTTRGPRS